jgi:hypothetical protein
MVIRPSIGFNIPIVMIPNIGWMTIARIPCFDDGTHGHGQSYSSSPSSAGLRLAAPHLAALGASAWSRGRERVPAAREPTGSESVHPKLLRALVVRRC